MTTVWQVLTLPDVPKMLKNCDKPLCTILKEISKKKKGTKEFSKCDELAQTLQMPSEAARGYFAAPTMARILLTLADENEEVKERFMAHTDITKYCEVRVHLESMLSSGRPFC